MEKQKAGIGIAIVCEDLEKETGQTKALEGFTIGCDSGRQVGRL